MYERFPYPNYPLFIPLRWQEAYASSSVFCQNIAGNPNATQSPKSILIAGCGDVQPYILSKIEPRNQNIIAVDISERSLRRAQKRVMFCWNKPTLICEDLRAFLSTQPGQSFEHMECYGVLHHLSEPTKVLHEMARVLVPGGSCRMMVYNSAARSWMRSLSRAMRLLGFDYNNAQSLTEAKEFLEALKKTSAVFESRLGSLGPKTIKRSARLVDTFFHEREVNQGLEYWLNAIHKAKLVPKGLYDRYAELDDLPNPMYHFPNRQQLNERIADKRFENNFELYLSKPAAEQTSLTSNKNSIKPLHLYTKDAPKAWFDYTETKSIPFWLRQRIWHMHIQMFYVDSQRLDYGLFDKLEKTSIQRLARIGAFGAHLITQDRLKDLMLRPMADSMEPPDPPSHSDSDMEQVTLLVRSVLKDKQQLDPRRIELILSRLRQAQS